MKPRALVLYLFAVLCAQAQNAATAAAPDAIKIGGITVSGSLRSRVYGWGWFRADSGDNSYAYSGSLVRIALSQSHEAWDWTAEFAAPVLLGLPSNSVAPGTQGALGLGANYLSANDGSRNSAMIFPKQLYVRFTRLGGSRRHMLKVGRYEFSDGSETTPRSATLAALKRDRINQRLLGSFGWSDVGRSFDGFHYAYSGSSGNFTLLAAVPTRGVFQTDGWGWNRAAFGYTSYTAPWGKGPHGADTRIFALYYDDFRPVLKTDNRPLAARRADIANIRILTFGGHTVHAVETAGGTTRPAALGRRTNGPLGHPGSPRPCHRCRGRIPAEDPEDREALAARRVLRRIGRRQSERQSPRDVLSGAAHAAAVCPLSRSSTWRTIATRSAC